MAQANCLVGDLEGNADKVIAWSREARDRHQADLIVFPELTLTGYPPDDLLLRPGFQRRVQQMLQRVTEASSDTAIVVGFSEFADGCLYNSAAVLHQGRELARYRKHCLPNYGVFDEKRYFTAGDQPCVVELAGIRLGITICEDVWYPAPLRASAQAGAQLILNLNASPFHRDKMREREQVVRKRVQETGLPLVYVNLVGGQDELVFDGSSFVMDATGTICQRTPFAQEGAYPAVFTLTDQGVVPERPSAVGVPPGVEQAVYEALVLGVRDYIYKNGFAGAVLGLSGGIDSALTLAIAVDAIGADKVEAVMMPSRYTADISLADAAAEARSLGVEYREISIEPLFKSFLDSLAQEFAGLPADTTEENIQARCRGVLLMAISNKKRKIVLTTGNKSEMAVGYATLYGDMAGGFDVLKDVPKTLVFRLAQYRNNVSPVIPQRVIDRPPSAELAPDQKDTDSLPPYPVLDDILERYIEQDQCPEDIIAAGHEAAVVNRVIALVDRNEYKRRQAPPGVRVTARAFGRDRRYPITSGYLKTLLKPKG